MMTTEEMREANRAAQAKRAARIRATIELESDGVHLAVRSIYHADLPARAKALGGTWQKSYWLYAAADETRVREMYRAVYGSETRFEAPDDDS